MRFIKIVENYELLNLETVEKEVENFLKGYHGTLKTKIADESAVIACLRKLLPVYDAKELAIPILGGSTLAVKYMAHLMHLTGFITSDDSLLNLLKDINISEIAIPPKALLQRLLKGEAPIIRMKDGRSFTLTSLEGWTRGAFFILHLCFLLKTYYLVSNDKLSFSQSELRKKILETMLLKEIMLSANILNIYYVYPNILEDRPLLEKWIGKFLASAIKQFKSNGDELCFPCGFKGHAIYLSFCHVDRGENLKSILLRVDNIGAGSSEENKLIAQIPIDQFVESKPLAIYLANICLATNQDQMEAMQLIRNEYIASGSVVEGLPPAEGEYSFRQHPQARGHCVVENFNIGACRRFYRLSEYHDKRGEPDFIFKQLCAEELFCIIRSWNDQYTYDDVTNKKWQEYEKIVSARWEEYKKAIPVQQREFNPPSFGDDVFIERSEEFKKLVKVFSSDPEHKEMKLSKAVCHGIGGVGKTQLAWHYAWKGSHHDSRPNYEFRIWFSAESAENLIQGYRRFCSEFKLVTEKEVSSLFDAEIIKKVKDWLEANSRWLLVYDYVTNFKAIQSYLPSKGEGDILITTRNVKSWMPKRIRVHVEELEELEAIELIKRRLNIGGDDKSRVLGEVERIQLKELVNELDCFPLALTQAAAYMIEGDMDVEEYLTTFRSYPKDVLESAELKEYPQSVAKTWLITMEEIQKQLPIALKVLRGCAYCAADSPIPEQLVYRLTNKLKEPDSKDLPLLMHQVRKCLINYSMLKVSKDKKFLSMRRLLQEVVRAQPDDQGEQLLLLEKVLDSLIETCPLDRKANEARRPWTVHFEKVIEHYDRLGGEPSKFALGLALRHLGRIYYYDQGRVEQGKRCLERAFSILKQHYGEDNLKLSFLKVDLGNVYAAEGKPSGLTEKQKYLEQARKIQNEDPECPVPERVRTWVNLGNLYVRLGGDKLAEGLKLIQQGLESEEKYYGCDNFEIATTLTDLAIAYGRVGNLRKKHDLLKRALCIEKRECGSEHYAVASTLVNLANVCGALGDIYEKCKLLEEAKRIQEKYYGVDHVQVARVLVNFGNAYLALGRFQEAYEKQEKAWKITKKFYPSDSTERAHVLSYLGEACRKLNDLPKAKAFLSAAWEIQADDKNDDYFKAYTLVELGNIFLAQGNLEEASQKMQQALKFGEHGSDFDRCPALILEGNIYGKSRNWSKGIEFIEHALNAQRKYYQCEHYEIARTLANLGSAYVAISDWKKAEGSLQDALLILSKYDPADFQDIREELESIQAACCRAGSLPDAKPAEPVVASPLPPGIGMALIRHGAITGVKREISNVSSSSHVLKRSRTSDAQSSIPELR